MHYPDDFDQAARANMERAEIEASRTVLEWRTYVSSGGLIDGTSFRLESKGVFDYILSVFHVFANEACALGRNGIWSADRVSRECRGFLELMVRKAQEKYGPRPEFYVPEMISPDTGAIVPEVLQFLEDSPAWQRYQSELLRIARSQGRPSLSPISVESLKLRIKDDAQALVDLRTPLESACAIDHMAALSRTGRLDNVFDMDLYAILLRGGLELVRSSAIEAIERDGELRQSQVRDLLKQTYSFLLDIWNTTGYPLMSATEAFARGRGQEVPKLRNILLQALTQIREDSRDGRLQPGAVDIIRKPASQPTEGIFTKNVLNRHRPRRTPDLNISRERLALVAQLKRELAIVKQEVKGYCTVGDLKGKHPAFALWAHIEDSQIKALVNGEEFTPKAYAENLTLAKFGLTSRETLKKDRRKLRDAKQAGQE